MQITDLLLTISNYNRPGIKRTREDMGKATCCVTWGIRRPYKSYVYVLECGGGALCWKTEW